MDPTPLYGARTTMPLRQRSPPVPTQHARSIRDHTPPTKHESPMPRSFLHSARQEEADEELYEERRAEELRRQIRERESELAKINLNKDRLRARIQSSLKKDSFTQSGEKAQTTYLITKKRSPPRVPTGLESSLAKSIKIQKPSENDNLKKETPRAFRIKPDPQNSQNEKNSLNMLTRSINQLTLGRQQSDPVKAEYMHQLSRDNQNLTKRLNLVTCELEKVTRECETLEQQLYSYKSEAQEYQRAIEDNNRADMHELQMERELESQKLENRKASDMLSALEEQRGQIVHSLNRLQQDRQRKVLDSEDLSSGLQKKLQIMQDYDTKKLDNIDRQQVLADQISKTEWAIRQHNQRLPEMQQAIDRLTVERDSLLDKYNQITYTNDHAVHEISRERASLESHNRRHLHFVAAKAFAIALNNCVKGRKQDAMSEFFNYCRFDQKCHKTLKSLANVLHNCGDYRMKIAINQWYQNTLKPYDTRVQKQQIADKMYQRKLRYRMLKRWQRAVQVADRIHEEKLASICKIKYLREYDALKIQQYAFEAWHNYRRLQNQRDKSLKYLLKRHHSTKLRCAINQWLSFCLELEYAVKNHILVQAHSTLALTQIAFSQLKERTAFQKRKRLTKLRQLFKGWQDSNNYHRFMIGANVAAAHILHSSKRRLLQACYDGLRHHMKYEQFECMRQSLAGNFEPALIALDEQLRSRAAQAFRVKQLRCLETLMKHTNHFQASYFHHWNKVRQGFNERVHKNLRGVLVRRYQQTLQRGFYLWRQGHNWHKNQLQTNTIENLTANQKQFVEEVRESQFSCTDANQRHERQKRYYLQKATNLCIRRHLFQSMRKWHLQCVRMTKQEHGGAGVIVHKIRRYWVRQTFQIYWKNVLRLRDDEQSGIRCLNYLRTRDVRKKRKVFNAICLFTNRFQRQVRSLEMMGTTIDVVKTRKALRQWTDQGNMKKIQNLKDEQGLNVDRFDHLNAILGRFYRTLQELQSSNRIEYQELQAMVNRVLCNYLARFYYIKAFRSVDQWKSVVDAQQNREQMLSGIVRHQKKQRFYVAKAAWQNWIDQQKAKELEQEIKAVQIRAGDVHSLNMFTSATHTNTVQEHDFTIQDSEFKRTKQENQMLQLLRMMIRRNGKNHYQGVYRSIFTRWRAHTRRQVRFLDAVTKTIEKSMWQNGLDNIRAFARDKHLTRTQNQHLIGMRRMYWKKNCGAALSRWREFNIAKAKADRDNDNRTTAHITHIKNKWKSAVKKFTGIKGTEFIRKQNLQNYYYAWRNVALWQRSIKKRTDKFDENTGTLYAKRALFLWSARAFTTRQYRAAFARFREFKRRHLMLLAIQGLKKRNRENRTLILVTSHLAQKSDTQKLQKSFNLLKAFSKDKQHTFASNRKIAAQNLGSALSQLYLVRMTGYLGQLKIGDHSEVSKRLIVRSCLTHWYAMRLRDAFNRFKFQAGKEATVDDVNTEGPVVESLIKWRSIWKILQLFLRDQGYTEPQIEEITEWARKQSIERLNRIVRYLFHQTPSRRLKPRVFNRWKQYAKLRKHIAYYMQQIINKLQPVKSDLSYAFNRWKFTKKSQLQGIDFAKLANKCGAQQEQMEELSKLEKDATEYTRQLEIQRDELVNSFMKGQRMCFSLYKSNKDQQVRKALREMSDHANRQKRNNFELVLQRNIELIDQLKERIRNQENSNVRLAAENEELRQFSLDGYQIARSVDQLNQEQRQMQLELGDQARKISSLRDESQELQARLKDAQEHAIALINHSNYNMRRMAGH